MEKISRKPAFAGSFYPRDPSDLEDSIRQYLDRAEPEKVNGSILAMVSPHAGYIYSGQTAAYGYRAISGNEYESVIVISPSHRESFDFCSIYEGDSYLTPLGEVPVDKELGELIEAQSGLVRISSSGHRSTGPQFSEHSLEVQVPFLQVVLGDFKLVPIVMGGQRIEHVEELASALAAAVRGRNVLIVASTDLSHFHTAKEAEQLDQIFIRHLSNYDYRKLVNAISSRKTEACGYGPVLTAMKYSRELGADRCIPLKYSHSGDVTGETDRVVGYLSAIFIDEDTDSNDESLEPETDSEIGPGTLSDDDRIFLLRYAREVLEKRLSGKDMADRTVPDSPIFLEKRGGFVTLKKNGQLRGCIGYILPLKPLIETVTDNAQSAALRDPRFPSVTKDELSELTIEISVLSPVREISDPSEVQVGRDGLIMTRGRFSGVLLPQVPVEWGWDREEFLSQTCRKAGLPGDCWKKPGTKIEAFTADVFSEEDFGLR